MILLTLQNSCLAQAHEWPGVDEALIIAAGKTAAGKAGAGKTAAGKAGAGKSGAGKTGVGMLAMNLGSLMQQLGAGGQTKEQANRYFVGRHRGR